MKFQFCISRFYTQKPLENKPYILALAIYLCSHFSSNAFLDNST